ncbi:oligosaccharide repeat unit polymerase [Escherichia albertii]
MKNKTSFYIAYIYIAPIILSLYYISTTNSLLGDFRTYSYKLEWESSLLLLIWYFIPLSIIFCVVKMTEKIKVDTFESIKLEKFAFYSIAIAGLITLIFGANAIGHPAQTGLVGIIIKIASKLNPLVLLPLLTFTNVSVKKFFFCVAVVIFYGYMQQSLQGIYISVLCTGAFLLLKVRLNSVIFILVLLSPIIFLGPLLDIITHLYTIRNEIRGVSFSIEEILSLALGRISTTSSLIYIISNSFNTTEISDYFTFGIVIERLIGVHILDTVSPSQVFNTYILGANAGYSIFMGLAGFFVFLLKTSPAVFIVNVVCLILELILIYLLIPVNNVKYRTPVFFLIMYLPFLSFDIWEISIVFQTIIIWRVCLLLSKISFRLK